ncbi:MAG: glycoside hydrolase family 2 TIM barrel-domain containing protein [Eubacteriales bacterium]|nr:glycoside hydrolase family 2 TIM barrel-domain containing protein [Eubacteriales bacterium]
MKRISLNGSDWKMKDYLGEDWIWRDGEKRDTRDGRWWQSAHVPGSVLNDLVQNGSVPDPHFEKNSLFVEWVPQRTWLYRKEFTVEENLEGRRIRLCFEGVDYDARFFLNDVPLGEHHSMFTPVRFDVTGLVKTGEKNLLAVVIEKAPDEQPQVSKTRYVKTHKSRMTYWWDFCPRMIHQGIWDDVFLEITGQACLGQPDLETRLSGDFRQARVELSVFADSCEEEKRALSVQAQLFFGGREVARQKIVPVDGTARFCFSLEQPVLWWPNGCGAQDLYEARLTLFDGKTVSDTRSIRFGIREITWLANETPDRTAGPYTLCVNGRRIYLKGYNWVPIDAMYGVRRTEKLRHLIRLAKKAHVNCLRIWGGGLIEREEFYDLCDENGILLWQEFIQSSSGIENEPSSDPAFLALMEREASQIIPRKKHHPSLAL